MSEHSDVNRLLARVERQIVSIELNATYATTEALQDDAEALLIRLRKQRRELLDCLYVDESLN